MGEIQGRGVRSLGGVPKGCPLVTLGDCKDDECPSGCPLCCTDVPGEGDGGLGLPRRGSRRLVGKTILWTSGQKKQLRTQKLRWPQSRLPC